MDIDLRDYFAAKAMQSFLIDYLDDDDGAFTDQDIVEMAYYMADMMIIARDRKS